MNRPRRAAKKPTGPELSAAECVLLRKKVKEDPSKRISRADGIKAVKEFFTSDVLDVTSKRLSLICPVTKKRIVDPARGINCRHLECVDLSAYLWSQISKPFWACPRCQKRVTVENLRIDEFTSYVLRAELDSVRSVEVYGDGSHRAVNPSDSSQVKRRRRDGVDVHDITLDDEPMIVDNMDEQTTPDRDPMIKLPLSLLVDFDRQTKDLLSRLPVRKGKRKATDPADLLEDHHDRLRSLIKGAAIQPRAKGTTSSPASKPVQDRELISEKEAIQTQNEGRNSALLAENLRLSHRVAELEEDRSRGRPKLRFIASTSKNTLEVLMWLDRFTLDGVQLACTLLKVVVDAYLPMAPIRVLEYVAITKFDGYTAALFARCPGNDDKRLRMLDGEPEDVCGRMSALCIGCAIEYFEVYVTDWTPTVRAIFAYHLPSVPVRKAEFYCPVDICNSLIQMMTGLESVYISRCADAATDDTMKVCAERAVARLGIGIGDRVSDEALLDFCFSNAPINGDPASRLLIMNFWSMTRRIRSLSKIFFEKLVKKCLDQTPEALPSVTLGCAVNTIAYDDMAKTHESKAYMCKHFQFEAFGEKFEIVVRKDKEKGLGDWLDSDGYAECHLILRKGHADSRKCSPPQHLYDWREKESFPSDLAQLVQHKSAHKPSF